MLASHLTNRYDTNWLIFLAMGTSSPPGTLASDLGTTERLSTTRPRTTGDDDAYDNDDNDNDDNNDT